MNGVPVAQTVVQTWSQGFVAKPANNYTQELKMTKTILRLRMHLATDKQIFSFKDSVKENRRNLHVEPRN